MCGGNTEQHNVAKSILSPPLKLLWSYDPEAGIGISAIAVSDEMLFFTDLQGEMFTLNAITGNKIGLLTFLGKDAGTTPLLNGQDVILSYAGEKKHSLTSYNLNTGNYNWQINLDYLQTSPILLDSSIYIGSLNGIFYSVNFRDGRINWSYNTKSQIHSTCAISEDKIVFGNDTGLIICLNLNGSKRWEFKTGASVMAAPMIYERKVFIGSFDSAYYCLNLDSGTVVWKRNTGTKLSAGSSLFNNQSVIFGGINGSLYSLKTEDGSVNWIYPTKGVITSTPLSSGNYVYFSNHDYMTYCIDGNTGELKWSYELEGRGKTSPVIWKNYLFIASDYLVYCFTTEK